jgi:hypothetical protein
MAMSSRLDSLYHVLIDYLKLAKQVASEMSAICTRRAWLQSVQFLWFLTPIIVKVS